MSKEIKIQNSAVAMIMLMVDDIYNQVHKDWTIGFENNEMRISSIINVMPNVEVYINIYCPNDNSKSSSIFIRTEVFKETKVFEFLELNTTKWKEQMMESSFWVKHKIIDNHPSLQPLLALKY